MVQMLHEIVESRPRKGLTKIAGIDPNLVKALRNLVGDGGGEVNVGHERNLVAAILMEAKRSLST